MILAMLRWWYGTGWLQALQRITQWVAQVEHAFSVAILTRTLFSPWRRIVTPGGKGLDAQLRAALDNLISRCVGFVVRLTVLIVAGLGMVGAAMTGIVIAIAWPFLPISVLYFLIRSITG